MNYLKISSLLASCMLFLFSSPFFSQAQGYEHWVMDNWNKDKDEAFKMAKEQDKFVLLFVGRPTCPKCQETSELFCNPEKTVKTIIDENFSTLYKCYDEEDDRADVYEYIQAYHEEREAGFVVQIPWLFIINPDREGEIVTSMYRPYPLWSPDVESMSKFLTVDLLEGRESNWYADEIKAFEQAIAEKKYVFRFYGKGTSPNSQKMMELLQEEPIKQLLEENCILWYVDEEEDCGCFINPSSGEVILENEEETNTLPVISIFYPGDPYHALEELSGIQEKETIVEILSKYTVSNELITSGYKVMVSGNVLEISNLLQNEQIQVFTLTGQQVATIHKNDYTVRIDASSFPKGVLIVYSSTGWSAKIVIR